MPGFLILSLHVYVIWSVKTTNTEFAVEYLSQAN